MANPKKWKIAVDRGGTFTDVVGIDPDGIYHSLKLLSVSPQYEDPSIEGVRRMLGLASDEALPKDIIEGIRFGTTVATNALLERKGCNVALLITKGFSDLLEIGFQNRPEIFSLCIKKSPPLYSTVIEVDERIDSQGRVVKGLDEGVLAAQLEELKKAGVDSVAIVLMHSWTNPGHELRAEEILKEHGVSNIFLSHRTVNLIKMVSRGQSTLVDSYLSTVLARYLEGIKKKSGTIPLEFIQSSGTLTPPEELRGKNAILSGPAGGVVAVARIADDKKISGAIGFDMGGTSTDVSRFDGKFEKIYEQVVGGIPLQTEMLNIVTVAAGGGSILRFDGQKMTAGPESAGSNPGPACYGFGGPLTVTDANLLTGRLNPEYFPKTFGRDNNSSLDTEVVHEKFLKLSEEINSSTGTSYSLHDIAAGFLRVANEKMAMAIKEISVSKGFDIRDHSLVCFGGAGGQHACSIAALLEIDKIIIHPLSGVMSAYGIGLSMPARKDAGTILKEYNVQTHEELSSLFEEMEKRLTAQGEEVPLTVKREIDLRPKGAEASLTLSYEDFNGTVNKFSEQYRSVFGVSPEETALEVVNLRIEVQGSAEYLFPYIEENVKCVEQHGPVSDHDVYYEDGFQKTGVYLRQALPHLAGIEGPAIIVDPNFTVVMEPGFRAEIDEAGLIVMTRSDLKHDETVYRSGKADPVLLEVFNNLFMGAAVEMGLTLKNTAHSVNMKERLDFSCALFDPAGSLVANAPHIPVHLGSMADTVKALIEDNYTNIRSGDLYLTNNPYRGGSHLPDMTIVCPVFSKDGSLIFFTAARGHHSDVGGTTPGSMPPSSTHIYEEGVLVDSFLLVRDGELREDALREILQDHKYPVRNIPERLADFRAQIAACHRGTKELEHIILRYGLDTVMDYMRYIQENSEYSVKKALHRFLADGNEFYSVFEDRMDDGTLIKARIVIDGGPNPPETLKAVIDFRGTGQQHTTDNLNAPSSVARSAVIYVLRSLIDTDIPLNSGCFNPVEIIIPEGTLLNPVYPSPVASGNVETSQRVVDVLLGALGIAAASQGTMNNLLFEVQGEPPYYETIAGGSGAMEGCPGASGVQVHMTNTRMTDPEILEYRHPGVRLEQFTLRKGSGGKGRFDGGDGVTREIRFRKPATLSILSERRVYPPYGAEGGHAGEKGENLLKKADGTIRDLGPRKVIKIAKDDSVVINTPGGGGYGRPVP